MQNRRNSINYGTPSTTNMMLDNVVSRWADGCYQVGLETNSINR